MFNLRILSALLLLTFFSIIACNKESDVQPNEPEAAVINDGQSATFRTPAGKVAVCHYDEEEEIWKVLNINENALDAHLGHGDAALIDADGDGYVVEENACVPGGDCDDDNAEINPGQEEIPYNGKDDDCNPETPDDDLDGDGFPQATDCDDTNPAINPDAEEIPYNGIDEDCNSETPDDDLDGDGFLKVDDCIDTDPAVNPNAAEVCDDGVDNNCDGLVDGDDGSCSTSCVEGELEVILPDGSILYVHPTDNGFSKPWGEMWNDIDGLDNINTIAGANADFDGLANTAAIVAQLGNWNGGDYAAKRCATLSAKTGCEWYLPAAGELNEMYQQLGPNGSNEMPGRYYQSSTEVNDFLAWYQGFFIGNQFTERKSEGFQCRCVRR